MIGRRRDEAVGVRLEVAKGFGILGRPSDAKLYTSAKDALNHLTTDTDKRVRIWAQLSLMVVEGKFNDATVLGIARHLRDPDVLVRRDAVGALSLLGNEGKVAVDPLIDALDDKDASVVTAAVAGLLALKDRGAKVVGAMIQLLQHKEEPVVLAAINALIVLENRSPRAIAAVTQVSERKEASPVLKAVAKAALEKLSKGNQ
jgi:HEAT repeat protein